MTSTSIYKDIAERSGGNIYIGVVGPVRTGKSTFIKKFCENLVIPNIEGDYVRERMTDELPQSSAGRTIMTTEPKFIPESGASLTIDGNINFTVRLIDCVGYIVPSSLGYIENEQPRMVKTPWFEDEIPFNMAAEIGTEKVISEHATIGLVITTDASISDIPRDEYEEAEERVINELKEINKPFIVLLNCMYPESASAKALSQNLSEKYCVPVLPVNCLSMTEDEIRDIIKKVLYEFPLKKITIRLPQWIAGAGAGSETGKNIIEAIRHSSVGIKKVSDVDTFAEEIKNSPDFSDVITESILLGEGSVCLDAEIHKAIFYKILSEISEEKLENDSDLISTVKTYAEIRRKYNKIEKAIEQVNTTGYGIVMPGLDELKLEEPEIVRHGSRYGVRLKASAPSVHMLRADIKTEVAPIVGSEKQSEDLVKYLLEGFSDDPSKIWESNIFGTSLEELVNEGLKAKLLHMPDDARMKLQQTLERVINEGCNGLICIII